MKTSLILLLGFFVLARPLAGQSPLGDADDKTSLVQYDSGSLSVNFADKSTKISHVFRKSGEELRWGFELAAKATDGVSTLFDGDRVSPDTHAAISIGWQPINGKTEAEVQQGPPADRLIRLFWTTLQVGYTRSNYSLYDANKTVGNRAFEGSKDLPATTLYYNALLRGNFLLGASAGWSRVTNYGDLTKVKVTETTVIDTNGSTTTTSAKTIEARSGALTVAGQWALNTDLLWVPDATKSRIGLDLLTRTTVNGGDTRISPGIGVFVLKDGAPTKIIGGLTIQYDPDDHKTKVGLAVGYPF